MATFIILLAGLFYQVVYAYPVPELPADNLIVNPWFRSFSDLSEAGFDGWIRPLTNGLTWGPSQKESNPSPDIVVSGTCGFEEVYCGTAARWAEQFGVLYPNIDVYAYQVVAADPSHRKLKFFTYYVSHLVELGVVSIYAGESPDGPWELLWVPLYHRENQFIIPESGDSRDLWQETGFLEWNFERGYPYYKIELHARLPESPQANGIRGVGFKVTGVYFSTAFTDEPGEPPPTPGYSGSFVEPQAGETTAVITETPSATTAAVGQSPTPSPGATSIAAGETEAEIEEATPLLAEAISPTEINLIWNASQNNGRGMRLERSLNMETGWQSIAQLQPGEVEVTDSGLQPDTVYYYRLRASQDEVTSVVSARTLPYSEPPLAAPASLEAISTIPSQVELRWSDLSDNETGFLIERSLDGLNFTTIETLGQNATSFIDTDVDSAVYYYRVQSYRNDTLSDYSEVVSVGVNDRERDVTAATESAPDQTNTAQNAGQSNDTTSSGPGYLIILALTFVALIIGIGLGVVLVRRRA